MRAQALVRRDKECGDDGLKDTPVPMPNTEVKLQHAESSWGIAPCEDRTLPCDQNVNRLNDSRLFFNDSFWYN